LQLFFGCEYLKSIDLSNTKIKVLETNVFCNCYDLKEIILPNTVVELQNFCIEDTKITSLNLPDLVKKIDTISTKEITCFCIDSKTIEVINSNIKFKNKSIDTLLEENKSFREINNLLKNKEEAR